MGEHKHPSYLRKLEDHQFRTRLSIGRQCDNTRAAAHIMRDVLADGRVTEVETPLLIGAYRRIVAEHNENLECDGHLREEQQLLTKLGDWGDRLLTRIAALR